MHIRNLQRRKNGGFIYGSYTYQVKAPVMDYIWGGTRLLNEFKKRIENNTLLKILNKVPVHKGDVFFIPAETIHAICSGILICEIQQNSNINYRVYDYDIRDKDGKPRELHIDKAVAVSDLSPAVPQKKYNDNTLAECKYFTVKEITCRDSGKIEVEPDSFRSLIVLEGDGMLEMNDLSLPIYKSDSVLSPHNTAASY